MELFVEVGGENGCGVVGVGLEFVNEFCVFEWYVKMCLIKV